MIDLHALALDNDMGPKTYQMLAESGLPILQRNDWDQNEWTRRIKRRSGCGESPRQYQLHKSALYLFENAPRRT